MPRDHSPILIDEFNGLWKRGDAESCPIDHFTDTNNIQYSQSSFKTRDGIDTYVAYPDVRRMYTFITQSDERILVLDGLGNIYDNKSSTPYVPILSITGMTDFAMLSYAGRAYINPNDGYSGLQNEHIYVYLGDGTTARKAGGDPPVDADGVIVASAGATGNVEAGVHIFAVVYETNTGFLTKIGPDTLTEFTASGTTKVDLSNISVSPNTYVVARHIVATRAIDPLLYTGDTRGYQFFFVPEGKIDDNTSTTKTVNFFDADLLNDASHLLDILSQIPAGVNFTLYHNRLISIAEYGDPSNKEEVGNISLARVSYPGEPEAFDAVSGLIIAPIDGNPLTNCQEYRDVLYLFKRTRTFAYTDNGDDPSGWPLVIIDNGIGAALRGIATILDSAGVNIDFLAIISLNGIIMFNGSYIKPETSWKIRDLWLSIPKSSINSLQILNDTLLQRFYITLPNAQMLLGDYTNGLDAEKIKWATWSFDVLTTSIAFVEINKLLIGSAVPTP